jgi:hypothetical protein
MSMALTSPQLGSRRLTVVAVGATAVKIAAAHANRKGPVLIQNQGSSPVFLGPATVAAAGANVGYSLAAGATYTDVPSGDELWGITASGTCTVVLVEAI